nr:hypothetical protein L203_05887 [Cryptococcus depauperatus CBS 7841]
MPILITDLLARRSSSPIMKPSPAKRRRRTSSPEPTHEPSGSPSRTLPLLQTGGKQHWRATTRQSAEDGSESPRLEGVDEVGPGGNVSGQVSGTAGNVGQSVVFTRDVNSRAPRSMMACVRCRRQKMKCDGPSSAPCRGCRQAGQPCIFEPRSRPKSISVMSSRPFYPGRPSSPASFYPSGPQPAPPITSRPISQEYAFRPTTREPISLPGAVGSIYSGRRSPPPPSMNSANPAFYQPPPPQIIHPPPFAGSSQRPPSPPLAPVDQRLRALERTIDSTLRPLAWVPSALTALQQSIAELRAQVAPRRVLTVADATWESYRVRAWPLTPWLVGLRDGFGLPGMVVDFLGRRAEEVERTAHGQGTSTMGLEGEARREVGRLISEGKEFGREEIRALQVLATWTNDPIYTGLAISQARAMGMQHAKRTQDDWREWLYIIIMDNLCHVPDYIEPMTRDRISSAWRDRLAELPSTDPAVRDRDTKLLAWLEFAELLGEVFYFRMFPKSGDMEYKTSIEAREKRLLHTWRHFGAQWESWGSKFGARNDPILSLHYTYAVLHSVSPVYMADDSIWDELAASPEGDKLLEQGRDAAIGVIQNICSPEIGRTLAYSYPLYRPLLALSVFHLISLAAALPTFPLVTSSFSAIMHTLRQAYDTLNAQVPGREALPGPSAGVPGVGIGVVMPGGLLAEVVESGRIDIAKKWVGMEVGRDAWRRIIG